MTNYKRAIWYLYPYELGTKKNNVGFARVETSNELCRITVHCTTNQKIQRDAKVILIRGKKGAVEAVEAGMIKPENGNMDARFVYEKGMIPAASFTFYDCEGIVLMFGRENYIAARWDDSSVSYEEIKEIERFLSRLDQAPKEKQQKPDNVPEETLQPKEDAKDVRIEYVPNQEIQIIQSKREAETKQPQAKEVCEEEDTQQPKESPIEPVLDKAVLIAKEKSESQEITEPLQDKSMTENKEVLNQADELNVQSPAENQKDVEQGESDESEISITSCGEAAKEGLWVDHPSARLILNKFVRMYPFDDGEIAECVRLEPKDIGLLPMNIWVLGNNSFLLHSYCSFRHILFAKKLTRTGCEYLLMVPGVMNKHEEQLAKMFGFQNFKCSRRRYARSGEFGYWYIPINFNS